MAHAQATAKVGAVVILAMLLMGGVVYFFVGRGTGGYPVDVSFKDALGIRQESEVRLAGVKIGAVKGVDVEPNGRRAVLHLRINPKQLIPESSVFTITSGGLLGEYFVQIVAPQNTLASEGYIRKTGSPPPFIMGKDLPSFDELRVKVAQLGAGSEDVIKNLKVATANVVRLTGDPALQRSLQTTASNAAAVSRQAALTTERLSQAIDEEMPVLRATLASVRETAQNVEPIPGKAGQLMAHANRLVTGLAETNQFLRDTVSDTLTEANIGPSLKETMANLTTASERFKKISADAEKISADLASGENGTTRLGALVTSVNQVATKASTVLDKITGVTNKITGATDKISGAVDKAGQRAREKRPGPQFEFYQRTRGEEPFRADVDLALAPGKDSAYIVGLRGIGTENSVNLQKASAVDPRFKVRYGLHAGKVGVGADYALGVAPVPGTITDPLGNNGISLDFYDPNARYLDLYGRQQISDKLGITVGVEDILHKGRPTIGLTYRP